MNDGNGGGGGGGDDGGQEEYRNILYNKRMLLTPQNEK